MSEPMSKGDAPSPDPLPCPFCGNVPDVNDPATFREVDGCKWGALVCCCTGPEVRTHYEPVGAWRDEAIAEWNKRAAQPDPALTRECNDADRICAALGLTVEQARTEGGSLHVPRIIAHINETLTALRVAHNFGVAMSDRIAQPDPARELLIRARDSTMAPQLRADIDAYLANPSVQPPERDA